MPGEAPARAVHLPDLEVGPQMFAGLRVGLPVGAEQGVVDRLAARLRVGPLAQLLGQPAVVGHVAFSVERQTFAVHVHFHALIARDDFRPTRTAFFRCLRMKRKLSEFDLQAVIFFQFLDTPGDEVAPGSDKIRKHLKNQRLRHNHLQSLDL